MLIGNCEKNKLQKFDTEKWKAGNQIERGNMATDLLESEQLIGKNQSEVLNLLGNPKDNTDTNFVYLVDFGYMTPFYLDIYFDKETLEVIEVTLSD